MPNPNTDRVIMGYLKIILPGYPLQNTVFATQGGPIYIQDEYGLANGQFPALLLEATTQRHSIVTGSGYDGVVKIDVTYFDRWDEQPNTIDQIRVGIDADLATMMANVQENSSFAIAGQAHATSIPTIDLSPYKGEIDKTTVPAMTLVKRVMTLTVNILPYDS